MAKQKTEYACSNCGARFPKWVGRCDRCGQWGCVEEEVLAAPSTAPAHATLATSPPVALPDIPEADIAHTPCGIGELDRVLGGGLVPGMTVLLGGEPGIGKSTVMLQTAWTAARSGRRVLYVTGEESLRQTRIRADRLGVDSPDIFVVAENSLEAITLHIEKIAPDLVIVDSIQIIHRRELPSAPGTVPQVRQCAMELICQAKRRECALFLVGHITKEGAIAGPKILEHLVDCVLYFEGDRFHSYRILRAIKNRYGSTNEIGVFEMTSRGLKEVPNPSDIFLAERNTEQPGSAIAATIEGSRPLLVEVQALASKSPFASPTRRAGGVDSKRVAMIIAVLEKFASLPLSSNDIFVSVVGGINAPEPAMDLSIAMAIASSISGKPLPADCVFAAELGLGGELRTVTMAQQRLREARKLGFRRAVLAPSNAASLPDLSEIRIHPAHTISEALRAFC